VTTAIAPAYPVRVTARLDPPLSRWLWLIKWAAAIPHYIVLSFLWVAFVLLSVVAFFAILFTGRYPRGIFNFNVGVLRWTWRVQYYTYGVLATDRYPPFTLAEVPDYPAHLDVTYPEHLSRGLVLIKWWLLAIPHYIIAGLFVGGGSWLAVRFSSNNVNWGGGGLIGVLAVVAGVMLLITGRYPQPIFDLLLGLNRWVLRVASYASLMTDQYPPFRLDTGGSEICSTSVPPPTSSAPAAGGEKADGTVGERPTGSSTPWSAGRVISVAVGSVLLLVSFGLFAGGGATLWGNQQRDAGFVTSSLHTYATGGYAITTDRINVGDPGMTGQRRFDAFGTLRVRAEGLSGNRPLFLGIAPSVAIDQYLAGVRHARLHDLGGHASTVTVTGGAPAAPPGTHSFWVARSTGSGQQTVTWPVRAGDWTIVAMNADGSRGLGIRADVGATVPILQWVATGLLIGAGILLVIGVLLVAVPVSRAGRQAV
jgi:hypothetical protein